MSVEADNVAVLRQAYEAWSGSQARNIDCWVSLVAEDARLASLADGAPGLDFTKPRTGRSEILDYLETLTSDWEMIFYRVDEFVAHDDRVVAIGSTSWRNRKTGKVFVTPKVDLWRLRNGKIVHFSEFYDTARVLAAARP